MSKRINVNPDHYKTAGRERMGDAVTQQIDKQQFKRNRGPRSAARVLPGARKASTAKGKTRRG